MDNKLTLSEMLFQLNEVRFDLISELRSAESEQQKIVGTMELNLLSNAIANLQQLFDIADGSIEGSLLKYVMEVGE